MDIALKDFSCDAGFPSVGISFLPVQISVPSSSDFALTKYFAFRDSLSSCFLLWRPLFDQKVASVKKNKQNTNHRSCTTSLGIFLHSRQMHRSVSVPFCKGCLWSLHFSCSFTRVSLSFVASSLLRCCSCKAFQSLLAMALKLLLRACEISTTRRALSSPSFKPRM